MGTSSACPIPLKLPNWSLEYRECSSERNLLTAWDRDSPSALAFGFLGRGTMNLPVSVRRWFSLKGCTKESSSDERIVSPFWPSSTSQNRCSRSVSSSEWGMMHNVSTWEWRLQTACENPTKLSFECTGRTKRPMRRPWRGVSTKMSTPRKTSILPGWPKSGSARWMSSKCTHEESKKTGWRGRSHVRQPRLQTSHWGDAWGRSWSCLPTGEANCGTGQQLQRSRCSDVSERDIVSETLRDKRGRWCRVKECSCFNRTTIWGEIRTRQVIRRVLDVRPAAVLDVTGLTDVPVDDGELCSLSKYNSEWCGFCRCLQRWADLYYLTKCPGVRQFIQIDYNVDTILSCARALKHTQAYNRCFSPLQRTQSAVGIGCKGRYRVGGLRVVPHWY